MTEVTNSWVYTIHRLERITGHTPSLELFYWRMLNVLARSQQSGTPQDYKETPRVIGVLVAKFSYHYMENDQNYNTPEWEISRSK